MTLRRRRGFAEIVASDFRRDILPACQRRPRNHGEFSLLCSGALISTGRPGSEPGETGRFTAAREKNKNTGDWSDWECGLEGGGCSQTANK